MKKAHDPGAAHAVLCGRPEPNDDSTVRTYCGRRVWRNATAYEYVLRADRCEECAQRLEPCDYAGAVVAERSI